MAWSIKTPTHFQLQLQSEVHSSDDRAGFSIIALSSDHQGIELGFWPNNIWAQTDTPMFTRGDGASFDTTTGLMDYELTVREGNYELRAGNTLLLSGPLQDYSTLGIPYSLENHLFFGDNTTSAAARSV